MEQEKKTKKKQKEEEDDQSKNANSKNINNRVVALAFACCFASFCFHAACFLLQLYASRLDDDKEKEPKVDTLFNLLANYPIYLASFKTCMKIKDIYLRRRMKEQNLVCDGDFEKAVVGTELYRETAMYMTKFSFASWVFGYGITLTLQYFLGVYEYMASYTFKGFMACAFGITSVMNLRVLINARPKMNKLIQQRPTN